MARKRYKPEEIVAKLRQVDVLVSQGQIKWLILRVRRSGALSPRQPDIPLMTSDWNA